MKRTLAALASEHAADMARRDSLDHDGFMTNGGPRGARAENVAYGCKESAWVIQQWVNSSGYRKNMLIPNLSATAWPRPRRHPARHTGRCWSGISKRSAH